MAAEQCEWISSQDGYSLPPANGLTEKGLLLVCQSLHSFKGDLLIGGCYLLPPADGLVVGPLLL